jgi:hypothetical protein
MDEIIVKGSSANISQLQTTCHLHFIRYKLKGVVSFNKSTPHNTLITRQNGSLSSRIAVNWIWLNGADMNEVLFLEICSLRFPVPRECHSTFFPVIEITSVDSGEGVCTVLSLKQNDTTEITSVPRNDS